MINPDTFDFLRYADDNNIEYVTSAGNLSRGWVAALNCGFCGEHNHKLGIGPTGTYGNCWACGHKSLYTLTKQLTPNLHYDDLIEEYSGYIDRRKTWNKKTVKATELEFNFAPLSPTAKKYISKRNFDPNEMAIRYGMADGGLVSDWRYRIIIPFYYKGQVVSYQGRAYNKELDPKYKFLSVEKSVVNPKEIFYNMDNATKSAVIVTEGVFDCLRLAGDGGDVIASLGISTSEAQLRLLKERYKTVHICYDPEPVAQIRAKKLAEKLSAMGVKTMVWNTELDYDLGDTSVEEAKKIKQEILGV